MEMSENVSREKFIERNPLGVVLEEEILESREVIESKKLEGTNFVFFVKLRNDGNGIFKPASGEIGNLRTEIEKGSYYKRERAAYLLDRALGLDLIPPTVTRKLNGEVGSMQQFIPNAENYSESYNCEHETELIKLWILDYIIWQSDRNITNILIDKEKGKIQAIDNGLSFGRAVPVPLRHYFDKPIPPEIIKKFKEFFSEENGEKNIQEKLNKLLNKEEVDACLFRLERIGNIIINYGSVPWSEKENLIWDKGDNYRWDQPRSTEFGLFGPVLV